MEKTKRLFVAINLPIDLKRELFDIQKEITSQLDEDFIKADVFKWVAMENLHLTLKFIGEVGDSQIEKIIANVLKISQQQKSFEIKTDTICYYTTKQCPQLIWLTIEKNKDLENLAKNFGENNFLGHITLARIKEWIFKKIDPQERLVIEKDFDYKIQVNSIELMESILKKTGPEYKIIKSFAFKK